MIKKIGFVSLLMLSGCNSIYIPTDIQNTVLVNVSEVSAPQIYANNDWQDLSVDANGYARVPFGKLILIQANYVINGYDYNAGCNPVASFVPSQNQEYLLNFISQDGICKIAVLRKSKQNKVGFVIEPRATSTTIKISNAYHLNSTYQPVIKK